MTRRFESIRVAILFAAAVFAGTVIRAEELPVVRLPREQFKSGEVVLRAFRPVVSPATRSTVRILGASDRGESSSRELALGVVVDAEGLILTKASQLESTVFCQLSDGRTLKAVLAATDVANDAALLRVEASSLPTMVWSEREPVVGQFVATPATNAEPIAVGVVSVRNRAVAPEKGILGIAVTDEKGGPKVTEIVPESGAAKAGLKVGDLILEISGAAIPSVPALLEKLNSYRPGTSLALKIRREEQTVSVDAVLGRRPANGPDRGEFQNSLGGELSIRRDGFSSVLQHDTVLRPEDCGGPIVGLDGKAVGLNIARAGRTESYALPASVVIRLVTELRGRTSEQAASR